jgi:hypothetical protein
MGLGLHNRSYAPSERLVTIHSLTPAAGRILRLNAPLTWRTSRRQAPDSPSGWRPSLELVLVPNACPNCEGQAVHTTLKVTPASLALGRVPGVPGGALRELRLKCLAPGCGHTWILPLPPL